MAKKGPSEITGKVPKPRKGTPEIAKKAPTQPVAPVAPKSAPVTKRQKETKAKVDETLLQMKTGLKFVVSTYIRTLGIPAEKLEETIRLTLENLSGQTDANGRKLDSLYWFREGCSVEVKNGKIFAKDPEGNTLVSGLKIKVIKPKKTAKKDSAPKPAPDVSGEAPVAAEPAPEEELSDDEVTPIDEAETPELAVGPMPAPAVAEVAEQATTQLNPFLITLLTKTNVEFQELRAGFDSCKSKPDETTLLNLSFKTLTLGSDLASLPDFQFQLPQVRLLRMRIGCLKTEIEQAISAFQKPDKKAVEMPSLITGLGAKVGAFAENANTWISEVDLITNTSRVPSEGEVQTALDKYTQLLENSSALRKTISDIATSPTFDGTLQPQINALKEQIAVTSKDIEKPVGKLQAFLASHKKPLPAPPPPPTTRFKDGGRVVNLRTVTARDGNMSVNADDVFRSSRASLRANKFLDWLKSLSWLKDLTR